MRASPNRGRRSTVARTKRGQMPKLGPSLHVPSQHATRSTDGSSQSPHSGTRSARPPVLRCSGDCFAKEVAATAQMAPAHTRRPEPVRRCLFTRHQEAITINKSRRVPRIWRGNRMDLVRFRDRRTEGLMDPRESREDDTGAATALTAGCGART